MARCCLHACNALQLLDSILWLFQGGRDFPPGLLLQILGVKIVTTAVCKGSGLVGGIYAPSIFMGARRTRLRTIVFLPAGSVVKTILHPCGTMRRYCSYTMHTHPVFRPSCCWCTYPRCSARRKFCQRMPALISD